MRITLGCPRGIPRIRGHKRLSGTRKASGVIRSSAADPPPTPLNISENALAKIFGEMVRDFDREIQDTFSYPGQEVLVRVQFRIFRIPHPKFGHFRMEINPFRRSLVEYEPKHIKKVYLAIPRKFRVPDSQCIKIDLDVLNLLKDDMRGLIEQRAQEADFLRAMLKWIPLAHAQGIDFLTLCVVFELEKS